MHACIGGKGGMPSAIRACLAVKADYGVFIKQFYMAANIQFLVFFFIYGIYHKDVLKQTAVCRCVSSPVGVS